MSNELRTMWRRSSAHDFNSYFRIFLKEQKKFMKIFSQKNLSQDPIIKPGISKILCSTASVSTAKLGSFDVMRSQILINL
jgi:hypothetical protein